MSDDCVLLQRYLDGDLTPLESEQLRARFAHEPELSRELAELRRVGRLLRLWADDVQHGVSLVEPILRRVQMAERPRPRPATLGFALVAALIAALPFARTAEAPAPALDAFTLASGPGAAIERIEPGDTHAHVFVVGATSTPVVWLSDETGDDVDAPNDQDPG
jgi:anti-sigma factor RsiW